MKIKILTIRARLGKSLNFIHLEVKTKNRSPLKLLNSIKNFMNRQNSSRNKKIIKQIRKGMQIFTIISKTLTQCCSKILLNSTVVTIIKTGEYSIMEKMRTTAKIKLMMKKRKKRRTEVYLLRVCLEDMYYNFY